MKLCELEAKTLKNVVTTKKEKKKDISFSKMADSSLTPINIYLYGNKDDTCATDGSNQSEVFYKSLFPRKSYQGELGPYIQKEKT